ncbi:MBL fold metallo-hydrolase [Streptomyces catenulae]|uniref:MBL fold metallo-hydrolase n=1 Tax=Streptomyces catenulae TaxID=66875 RepID=A0ABV2YZL9_9ACTN|nr:MBL fold metallo-hydrolase [Streptomyces catenulae]
MCGSPQGPGTPPDRPAPGAARPGRRQLLAAGGAGLALGLAGEVRTPPAASAAPATPPAAPGNRPARLELVLLGTRAGPPPVPDRAGISTALIVDGHIYLVDCGRASVSQFARAGLTYDAVRAIFLTHLHIDHTADYYHYFVLGGCDDARGPLGSRGPVDVYGPGPAGGLPPVFGSGSAAVISPSDPTPGTRAMTEYCHRAHAYSSNLFRRDSGQPDVTTLMDVHEIQLPASCPADHTRTAPAMRPFTVMSDDRVHVTAVLVPHGPVFPSFAFRFDTAYGSVTFSGDTTYTDNLVDLAQETDLLIHEAVNVRGSSLPPALHDHLLQSHVEVQQVGRIAQRAGARKLVLSHLADFTRPRLDPHRWQSWARDGYRGPVVVGEDLQRIVLRR